MKKNLLFSSMLLVTCLLLGANVAWADIGTPILTLTAPVGNEVSLTIGVWDTEDEYAVDFGDGTLQTAKVGVNNAGPVDPETGQTTGATVFKGTVAGDGTIKVYGNNDVWYLITSGGAMPALEQEKLMNVVQMGITGADVESVTLPAYPQMTQFSFNNSPVKSLDVSKVATLTSLTVDNTTLSQFAPQLESIDLSANTELNYLKIVGNATSKGRLSAIDLSKNSKLANVYLQDNALKTAVMPAGAALSFLNLQNNELETIDLSVCESNKDVYLNNNRLKSATLGTVTKSCKLEDNELTLATIPAQPAGLNTSSKTKKFTYAPQAAMPVEEKVTELDLSSQLAVAQGELDPADYATYLTATTTYSLVTASGTALVEGTDYEVTEPGKFKFIKEQTEKVHAEMLNAALPKFTAAVPFKTSEFTIVPDTGISNVDANQLQNGKFYNLQGIEVQKLIKGVYIHNGRKVVVK